MKNLFLALVITPVMASANTPAERLENLVDVLSGTPASLNGHVSIGKRAVLGRAPVPMGILKPNASVEWREYRPIAFDVSENDLSLTTEGAVVIKVMGLTVGVKSIRYTNGGHFSVDLKLPLVDKKVEAKIARVLEEKYKSKMDKAFRELSSIRKQKGKNTSAVIENILNIFKDPSGGPSALENVPMTGSVELNFNFDRAKTLEVSDKYVVDIQAKDMISAGAKFNRQRDHLNFSEIEFRSTKGVTFRPENAGRNSLGTLRMSQITFSERGIEPMMVTGAEEAVTDVKVLIGLLAAAEGASELGKAPNCDPRIEGIQTWLQGQLHGQLIPLIRQHRTALIRAGIDPDVLKALGG